MMYFPVGVQCPIWDHWSCTTSKVLRNNTNQHVSGLFRGQIIGVAHDHHEYVLLVTSDHCVLVDVSIQQQLSDPTHHSCYCYDALANLGINTERTISVSYSSCNKIHGDQATTIVYPKCNGGKNSIPNCSQVPTYNWQDWHISLVF